MKKESLQLVKQIYERLKFNVAHPDLEELFGAAQAQATFMLIYMGEENPNKQEKYTMMSEEINKITFKQLYS